MRKSDEVPVNWGKLLEAQLERWRGGRSHGRGIAEYITNSDDSYRRLKKFSDQLIEVEVHSRRGRHIDKLIIRDFAEGMSHDDLENRFFLYFESASGREEGALVTGKFGTGGKAYAIMNFKKCWITSVKDGRENKAWFEWDPKRQRIVRNYNKGGYRDKAVKKTNQTVVELHDSIKVTQELAELVLSLEKLARIRHVLKNQKVSVRLVKRGEDELFPLEYTEPSNPLKIWNFRAPQELWNGENKAPTLHLRYFQKPLDKNSFIDVSDGISSVADLEVSRYDGRPFSKYFNGSLTLKKLLDSSAVKENRKGLEEGDDLTDAIEEFVKASVYKAVSEIEEEQRSKERERRLSAANEKMQELSRFLRKCELNFKLELKELKKRSIKLTNEVSDDEDDSDAAVYRKPTADDPPELLIRGRWSRYVGEGPGPVNNGSATFTPDDNGDEFAVHIGGGKGAAKEQRKTRQGLRVSMSDDGTIPEGERPVFSEFDDPVSDRDMVTKGIVWINANHPRIIERRTKSENDPVFLEMVANYVFIVVGQHQAQKQYEAEPEEERSDQMLLFRQKFFKLQRELLEDKSISYFESEAAAQPAELLA
jgi:hypothetical protein